MELLEKRLANLLTIKSIVTVTLTAVFSYLTVAGHVSAEQFLTVFTVVIAFYFGTQSERKTGESERNKEERKSAGTERTADGESK